MTRDPLIGRKLFHEARGMAGDVIDAWDTPRDGMQVRLQVSERIHFACRLDECSVPRVVGATVRLVASGGVRVG